MPVIVMVPPITFLSTWTSPEEAPLPPSGLLSFPGEFGGAFSLHVPPKKGP